MDLSGIDLNLMVAFDALIRERSVTRAGRALNLSQPAMSNALKRLRSLLGDPLLVRAGGAMVPTDRAVALHPQIRVGLQHLQTALSEEQAFVPATSTHCFRVAITDHTAFVLLPAFCRHLCRVAPQVSLECRPWRGQATLHDLEAGRVDLSIGIGPLPQGTGGLHRQRLFPDRFVSLVRQGHPAVHGDLDLETYLELSHVLVSPAGGGAHGVVDEALQAEGLSRRVAVTVPHFLAAPFVVAQSDHIVTLSETVSRPFAKLLSLTVHEPPLALGQDDWVAVWHERTHAQGPHRWLRREMLDIARRCVG